MGPSSLPLVFSNTGQGGLRPLSAFSTAQFPLGEDGRHIQSMLNMGFARSQSCNRFAFVVVAKSIFTVFSSPSSRPAAYFGWLVHPMSDGAVEVAAARLFRCSLVR